MKSSAGEANLCRRGKVLGSERAKKGERRSFKELRREPRTKKTETFNDISLSRTPVDEGFQ